MATDYPVSDRDYWVDKAKREWAIHKLITDNEKLEARVKELEAKVAELLIDLKEIDVRD